MLTLGRRPSETIRIEPDIVIVIKRVSGKNVSVGVEAPGRHITRGELDEDPKKKPEAA